MAETLAFCSPDSETLEGHQKAKEKYLVWESTEGSPDPLPIQ